jgi:hypothetical protein
MKKDKNTDSYTQERFLIDKEAALKRLDTGDQDKSPSMNQFKSTQMLLNSQFNSRSND